MIIKTMQSDYERFLGKHVISHGKYTPSKYNYYVSVGDNVLLCYNTFSGVVAVLSDLQYECLSQTTCDIMQGSPIELLELAANRLIVPVTIDETHDYFELYETVKGFIVNPPITSYTVLTTTGCNAQCFYCFEHGFKADTMRTRTAETVANYMITNCHNKPIHIHWFGGEPLCNTNAMDVISKHLDSSSIRFSSTMTSNGYAFTERLIERAVNFWNLKSIQITLDGLRDEHNRRKNFVATDLDPFEKTIKNIHALICAGISVSLRLNFDKENLDDIYKLIDYLASEFTGYKNISAYPVALFEECNTWSPNRNLSEQLFLNNEQRNISNYIYKHFRLSEKNVCRGFSVSHCGANNPAHRTINPNGSFSFCHNFSDSVVYGSIYEGIVDTVNYQKWMNNGRLREKCLNCIWLPECTTFDMCPVRKTFCQIDYEEYVRMKLIRLYKNWKSKHP